MGKELAAEFQSVTGTDHRKRCGNALAGRVVPGREDVVDRYIVRLSVLIRQNRQMRVGQLHPVKRVTARKARGNLGFCLPI